MFNKLLSTALGLLLAATGMGQTRQVNLTLLETSDIHGNYLPYDFMNGHPGTGSMARVATYVDSLRQAQGNDAVILVDNGDILQGQPSAYYYNYIDTTSTHLCAAALNFLKYDVATVGNHDIETGHAVYDRWVSQCHMPMLGANVINTTTGKPYWKPYVILERQGVKIAVLGMITPGIPQWLPENLWTGLRFDDMVATARRYMPEMRRQADLVVGLFHSGVGREGQTAAGEENASIQVAEQVPGFDLIFCGHDHRQANRYVRCLATGDSVLILNPAANAQAVARADAALTYDGKRLTGRRLTGSIASLNGLKPQEAFTAAFAAQTDSVKAFTNRVIGTNDEAMTTEPAFFGPSAFIDFLHQMQLSISGADLSFAAPLAFDATIPAGEIRVRDMFNLYRYENMLYVMELTGQEVKDYLEYSYAGWTNQMRSADDHLLLFRPNPEQYSDPWQRLVTPSYNFDSAAGIIYTVDVTKPRGQKVEIKSMADGSPFDLKRTYRCAINSYRGNGGGGLLTEGAHIPAAELPKRIVWSTDKDLRYYLMVGISAMGRIDPTPLNEWKFIPESWTVPAAQRDAKLLK